MRHASCDMRHATRVVRHAFFFLWFIPLGFASASAAEVVDRVVAIVGGEMITLSDVKGYAARRRGSATQDPLEALIREKLLKQEMERLGIAASEEEIGTAVREVLARNGVTLETLKGEIARKGISWETYRKELADQIREMKFLGQVIFPRLRIDEDAIARRVGPNPTEEARLRARRELMQTRAPEELNRYLDEVRARTHVEIKK